MKNLATSATFDPSLTIFLRQILRILKPQKIVSIFVFRQNRCLVGRSLVIYDGTANCSLFCCFLKKIPVRDRCSLNSTEETVRKCFTETNIIFGNCLATGAAFFSIPQFIFDSLVRDLCVCVR